MTVKAKKHLGQHFLNDESIAKQIVNGLTWVDYNRVLEIGPGMGVLTKHLLKDKKNVSVIEIDDESVSYLQEHYLNLKIYNQDFLKLDLVTNLGTEPLAIIGNFPYNISSQIIFKIIEQKTLIPEMVGMFQKEVAERIASPHGNKTYGILSVLTQAFYKVEYLFTVSEHVFTPPPKVKSGVIRMQRHTNKLPVNERLFFTLVKTAFNQRRKTLKNALKSLNLPLENLNDDLLKLRAEQLSVQQFISITKSLS